MQAYGNSRILFADYNNFVNAGRLCRSFPWRTKESAIAYYVVFLYYYFVVVVSNLNIVPRFVRNFSRRTSMNTIRNDDNSNADRTETLATTSKVRERPRHFRHAVSYFDVEF